ncbi:MAG: electron transfer flavoprotein subunit alpha/FixB family protein [Candidatus Aminicenantes bacterium]|nr:MAG: electron transfer flavoprotein subunit alpha/FixB family protein [Candidatus Aminicenantes bacterium]
MAQNNRVLICGEHEHGKISKMTKELLSAGKKLAGELNGSLCALFIGSSIRGSSEEAIAYGADKIYLVDNPALAEYNPDSYTDAITQACKQIAPDIILLGHTTMGRDIAGRVAYRLECFPCTDCIKLYIDPDNKSLVQTRSVFGGKALAVVSSKDSQTRLATLKPRAVTPLEPDRPRKGEIENIEVTINDSTIKTRLLDTTKEEMEGINLEDARVIVAGGGGIGDAEGFNLLRDLAGIWRGAVGTTTVPYDEGWIPTTRLVIGDSGKTVKPDLYFAIGIRGASQHITGCSESKLFVSINKDADAGIFKVSDIGVVADYRQVLPLLIEKCKALKAG